ncbi:MAG: hypothetical protein Q9160_005324 [Pyrenula sp. 1 TL-2023]
MGATPEYQDSIPITNAKGNFRIRSNQRAELYAAKVALGIIGRLEKTKEDLASRAQIHAIKASGRQIDGRNLYDDREEFYIVATDSEYVANDWRTSKGTRPANLDLFQDLDATLTSHEARNIKIGFWHIPREYNEVADKLAKTAAKSGDPVNASTSEGLLSK